MCARVSLSKFFAPSFRKSYSAGFGTNKGSTFPLRRRIPEKWRSFTTLYGYPVNLVTGFVEKQIMNALHLGERRRASSLLSHIGSNKNILRADHFVPILQYCALTPDPLFVMEIWRIMDQKGIEMNNQCHILMIQALCKGGYIEEAFNLMTNCGETSDLYPTVQKYNTLLRASVEMKSISHAIKCLDLMERDMVGKDEITYTQLLEFCRIVC